LVTSITTRVDPISLEDLYGHLLTHERRIEHNTTVPDLLASSINIAQRNFSSSKISRPPSSNNSQYNGRGRGHGKGHGLSSQGNFSSCYKSGKRPVCQVCHKVGHTATKCYHRFDHAYQGDSPNPAAYFTSPHMASDPSWYYDTGSTHHLTNDLSNLNMRAEEYTGID
jgi:hypothetical protein